MARVRKRQNYHRVIDSNRGGIGAYRNVGLSYREIGRRVNYAAMMVMLAHGKWTEQGAGASQPRRQHKRIKQLALCEFCYYA